MKMKGLRMPHAFVCEILISSDATMQNVRLFWLIAGPAAPPTGDHPEIPYFHVPEICLYCVITYGIS